MGGGAGPAAPVRASITKIVRERRVIVAVIEAAVLARGRAVLIPARQIKAVRSVCVWCVCGVCMCVSGGVSKAENWGSRGTAPKQPQLIDQHPTTPDAWDSSTYRATAARRGTSKHPYSAATWSSVKR